MILEKQKYFPYVDALRFISFIMVFVSHCFSFLGYVPSTKIGQSIVYYFFYNGDLGVHFFFVLSGFLIAIKLIDEKEETLGIDLFQFYKKRVLRIWPVYYIVLFGICLNASWISHYTLGQLVLSPKFDKNAFYHYFFFLGNYELIAHGIKNNFITILWSISVEEQFYALCPLFIKLTQKRYLSVIMTILVIISLGYRFILCEVGDMAYKYNSLSMILYLAAGCWSAWLTRETNIVAYFKALRWQRIAIAYIIGFAVLPLRRLEWANTFLDQLLGNLIYFFEAIFFVFVILEQNFSEKSLIKLGASKTLSFLGTRTYGMYAYHLICLLFAQVIASNLGVRFVHVSPVVLICVALSGLFITIIAAEFSFRCFEIWFLSMRGDASRYVRQI